MATPLALSASLRTVTGRHVHALRRQGQVPAILYGHNVEPISVAVDGRTLQRVWHHAGHSRLVDLAVDGGTSKKVLIRELQIDPRSSRLIHADLFAVNLREKLTVEIPLVPLGESPAVTVDKVGVLQQVMSSVKVECMPSDIPAQLTVDITGLVAIDDGVRLGDVPLPEGVVLAHGLDPEELVLKVSAVRVTAETEEEAATTEGAEAEPGAEEAGGEAPADS